MWMKRWTGIAGAFLLAFSTSIAQEDEEKFEKQSVAFRTALYYDPALEPPLEKLLELYRSANRVDELVDIYHAHTLQFPQDAGARVVRLRLLAKLRKPELDSALRKAVEEFPDNALVRRVEYEHLKRQRDPRALEALSAAISKSADPARKRQWTEELVKAAGLEDRGDLAKRHLDEILGGAGSTPESLLAVARQLHGARFHTLALKALERAEKMQVPPETGVEIVLLAAKSDAALGNHGKGQERLTNLLKKVAPDYWRRREIVTLRIHIVQSDSERENLLRLAREAFDEDKGQESLALDLSALLVASDLRREAIEVLAAALEASPHSAVIEKEALGLFDRLNDAHGSKSFLRKRLEASPDRLDLTYRLVKAMYVTGESDPAREMFEEMLGELDEEARFERRLDLARYLRRMSLPEEAIAVFLAAMEDRPERLDVRRELAETYLSTGKRGSARLLFTDELAEGATIENFLDVAQFLVGQEMLGTAKRVLENRRLVQPDHFELRLLLVDVFGKLGEKSDGEDLLTDTRDLADTEARYRRWLETGVSFHGLFGTESRFFDDEQRSLTATGGEDGKGWTPEEISRFYAFCEAAGRNSQKERAIEAIRSQLADPDLEAEWKTRLRQLLVEAIQRDPGSEPEIQEQLNYLMRDDPERESNYQAKLATLYHQWSRSDLARPIVEKLDFSKVDDSVVVSALSSICFEYSLGEKGLAALERTIELDPANRPAWEKWIAALAAIGDEARLRTALRQIISGVDRMPISEDTRALLNLHLADSFWRSIAAILAEPDTGRFAEVLPLTDSVERVNVDAMDILWAKWAKAFVYGKLGREEARKRAVSDLEEAINASAPPEKDEGEANKADAKDAESERLLYFPDGLATSSEAALGVLGRRTATRESEDRIDRVVSRGLTSAPRLDWTFETDRSAEVARIVPLVDSKLFVIDVHETGYVIDIASGKLIWSREIRVFFESGAAAEQGAPQPKSRNYYGGSSYRRPLSVVSDGKGMLFFGFNGMIRAVDAETGKLRWGAQVRGKPLIMSQPSYSKSLFLEMEREGRLLAWDPLRASAACFDTISGKIIWERILNDPSSGDKVSAAQWSQRNLHELNSGCSVDNGYFFVFGAESAVLDSETGNILWTFKDGKVRRLPLRLEEPEQEASMGGFPSSLGFGPAAAGGGVTIPGMPGGSWSGAGVQQAASPVNHLLPRSQLINSVQAVATQSGYIAAPAVVWAGNLRSGQNCFGFVSGEKLVLKSYSPEQSIFSLALPLGAKSSTMTGALVGTFGGKACYLSPDSLIVESLKDGRKTTVKLESVKDAASDEVQAVIDGARVYVCGNKGMMGISLLSGRRIFEYPWPEALEKILTEEGDPGSPTQKQAPSYLPRGMVVSPAAKSSPLQIVTSFSSRSPYSHNPPTPKAMWIMPMRLGVGEDRLFIGFGNRVISVSGSEKGELR